MTAERTTRPPDQALSWAAVLLILLGEALRFYRIDGQHLSGDEAYSVVIWVQSSLDYLLNTIALATTEPHPPLALLVLHGWAALTGESLLALRMLSALASVITLAGGYTIARWLAGKRAALFALALLAVDPFQVWYAQFARNYSLWMSGSALTVVFLLWAWKKPAKLARWIPYVLAAVATGYTFYLEVFVFAAHNLYALTRIVKRRGLLPVWAGTQIIIAALLAPWYLRPELWLNSREYVPNGEPANPLWGIQAMLFGDTLPRPWQHPAIADPAHSLGIASAAALILLVGGLFVLWKTARRESFWFLLFYGLAPVTILSLLALITSRNYFHPRYIAADSLPLALIIGLGIAGLCDLPGRSARWRQVTALAAGAAAVSLSLVGLWHYHFDPAFARGPDWPSLMRLIDHQAGEGDLIVRNYPDPAFDYYYQGAADQVVVPDAPGASYRAVAGALSPLVGEYQYIWFLPVESAAWDSERNAARWLESEQQYISDQWVGPMRLFQYAGWEVDGDQTGQPLDAKFAGVARLVGYRVTPPVADWQPGIPVFVELFWQPAGQPERPLKIFLHLRGPAQADGSIVWAQDDQFPQEGRIATDSWAVGSLFRDVYRLALPEHPAAGEYLIAAGFYDPETGARVQAGGLDYAAVLTVQLP